jgi:hypothetical protein
MMTRYLTISLALIFFPAVRPLQAASLPHAGSTEKRTAVWTNEDLEKLEVPGLISVVGQIPEEDTAGATAPAPYVSTKDPEWYAEQASNLRAELASNEADLQQYRQAIEDARDLKTMAGGMNLDEGDVGITPEASIEILQQRVNETQTELDELEDLARRNDIPPGALRGQ